MPISLLTNFSVNQAASLDDRLVVTSSVARDAIVYKYDGLTVFKTDDRTSWTWNSSSATWSYNISGNGIYAGSGALIGDTTVYTGNISNTPTSPSNKFIMSASSSSSGVYFTNYFYRNTFGTDWTNVEWRMQYSHDSNTSDISYISLNGYDSTSNGIVFVTGNKNRMTITNNGLLRLWSPTYSADINTSNLTSNQTYTLPTSSGALALYSDVISYINATISSISLQKVTSNGATSSFPITLNATFSLTQTAKQFVKFDDNSYIISGVISATGGSRPVGSYTDSFNIFNFTGTTGVINCEVICNATGLFSYFNVYEGPYYRYSRVSKISASFYWNGTTYTQIGTTTTIFTHAGGPGTSYALPTSYFYISGSNLRFSQPAYTPPPGEDDIYFNSLNTRIYYKLNISRY